MQLATERTETYSYLQSHEPAYSHLDNQFDPPSLPPPTTDDVSTHSSFTALRYTTRSTPHPIAKVAPPKPAMAPISVNTQPPITPAGPEDKPTDDLKHSASGESAIRYELTLPPVVTPELVTKLKAIAVKHNVGCTIETISANKVLKLEGTKQAVQKTITEGQIEIIDFQVKSGGAISRPPDWEEQTQTTECFDLQAGTEEWLNVTEKIKRSMPSATIVRIRRIQNQPLWEKYILHKRRMQQLNGGKINEKELFHGPKNTPPEQIYSSDEGFDMRFSTQGTWGQANHFSVSASYSNNSAYLNSNGESEIFLVTVLTGDSYKSKPNSSLRMPPVKHIGASSRVQLGPIRYDTVNGRTRGSDVYMTYSSEKVYPTHIITYR